MYWWRSHPFVCVTSPHKPQECVGGGMSCWNGPDGQVECWFQVLVSETIVYSLWHNQRLWGGRKSTVKITVIITSLIIIQERYTKSNIRAQFYANLGRFSGGTILGGTCIIEQLFVVNQRADDWFERNVIAKFLPKLFQSNPLEISKFSTETVE